MTASPHDSGLFHVTGASEYIDDRPLLSNEVHVDVFYSSEAHAEILSIDILEAKKIPGVIDIYTGEDIGHNNWGTIFKDQTFLATKTVRYVGEPIAIIAAENKSVLHEAKKKILVKYKSLLPVFSIDEAIKLSEFIGPLRKIQSGDIEQGFKNSDHVLEGEIEIAGQDHFYLESQACIAYPKEGGCIEVHSSSQHPTEVQHVVAEALGLKLNQVICVVKRLGGGFGGKESQAGPFAVYAALVAKKLGRPTRIVISKDDDMIITGKRNPFKNFYKVGFKSDGSILALQAHLYSDGGAYADLSTAIMERAMLHLDNAYYIPNFYVAGQVCRTNTAPNTAFRGFGGPKGVVTIENIIEEMAQHLKIDAFEIRRKNIYREGQKTPYGQVIDDDVLSELFEHVVENLSYNERVNRVNQHNKSSLDSFRGISVTAVKFGISFTTRFLNQGSALVNLHLDGTFQVSTGETEMGQGVNTKISQVVADCFGLPVGHVKIMPTSTEKNPNTSATAASSGSDINGQAALNAATTIRNNLAKIAIGVFSRPSSERGFVVAGSGTSREIDITQIEGWENILFESGSVFDKRNPSEKIQFSELVQEAYLNRVPLTEQGFYKYPEIYYNKETGQGRPFYYFTNGVALSEVSVDKFTGELKVLESQIIMDLGRPINPEIDMGQVTGAFIQGLGWVSTEKLFYNEKGRLVSCSPSTYKIPSIHDIPRVFDVHFLENNKNMRNLKGSKAVGEPPLLLAISVWTAIKNALQREKQSRVSSLRLPATQEEIYSCLRGISEFL